VAAAKGQPLLRGHFALPNSKPSCRTVVAHKKQQKHKCVGLRSISFEEVVRGYHKMHSPQDENIFNTGKSYQSSSEVAYIIFSVLASARSKKEVYHVDVTEARRIHQWCAAMLPRKVLKKRVETQAQILYVCARSMVG